MTDLRVSLFSASMLINRSSWQSPCCQRATRKQYTPEKHT